MNALFIAFDSKNHMTTATLLEVNQCVVGFFLIVWQVGEKERI